MPDQLFFDTTLFFKRQSGIDEFMTSQCKHESNLIGAHFSIAGGLEKALLTARGLGCDVVQIFSKNARTWKESMPDEKTARLFISERRKADIAYVLSHASYLINIASNDPKALARSNHALESELIRSALLEIDYLVLHPGAFLSGTESLGIEQAADSIKTVLSSTPHAKTRLLIETTAGQGTCIGHRFEQIARILEKTGYPDRTGVCLDTCHIFCAGYDIRTRETCRATLDQFDRIIGLNRLFSIHLNDSKTDLGSRKDRHDHIGRGCIGDIGFEMILNDNRLRKIPKILETPKELDGKPMDPVNLKRLLSLIKR